MRSCTFSLLFLFAFAWCCFLASVALLLSIMPVERRKACVKFLPNDKDRLTLIISLTVLYPVFCGCFFVIFLFSILPLVGSRLWLHMYWLVAAGVWVLLLAIFLPLMGYWDGDKSVSYKRESGVSIKEYAEKAPLASKDSIQLMPVVSNGLEDSTPSLKEGFKGSSKENLFAEDSVEDTKDSDRESLGSLPGTINRRMTLTQSGEFLSDCMSGINSDEDGKSVDSEGEIIKGNTNCQVHVSGEKSDTSEDEVDTEATVDADEKSCEEPVVEKMDRTQVHQSSQYADVEKTEQLVQREAKEKLAEQVVEDQETEESLEELPQARLREKAKGLPSIDTNRASQADCYAPSTMSPRESNVVFLYVNPDDK